MVVWIDLETGGLDPQECPILEVGCIVTDDQFNEIWRERWVIHTNGSTREKCDSFVREMHEKSKLWDACKLSPWSIEAVDSLLAEALTLPDGEKKPPLAGSSVHFDRKFMDVYMPKSIAKLTHRNIDVSSFKEVFKRILPGCEYKTAGDKAHRALDDLDHSIAELKYYVGHIIELKAIPQPEGEA